MEDIIHPVHGIPKGRYIPHIADIKPKFIRHLGHFFLEFMAHIILLFLISGENADFADVGVQKSVQNGMSE